MADPGRRIVAGVERVGGPPSPTRMVWRVRIYPAGSAEIHEIIDVAEPHLADGLEAAVAAAERREQPPLIIGAAAGRRA